MKNTIIPKGYRLTIISWENDGDAPQTKVIEGLSRDEVVFRVALCKLLRSHNDSPPGYGNLWEPNDEEVDKFRAVLAAVIRQHIKVYPDLDGDESDEMLSDYGTETLFDMGLSHGEWFTRVCESWKVEHVPQDIILKVVTQEF
jgi:hypothetical protein